jgi:hypothetical protein
MTESGLRADVYEDGKDMEGRFSQCVRTLVMQGRKAGRSIKTSCDGRPDNRSFAMPATSGYVLCDNRH